MRIVCHLRHIRERLPRGDNAKPVSLRDISERTGISPGQLSGFENGRTPPLG